MHQEAGNLRVADRKSSLGLAVPVATRESHKGPSIPLATSYLCHRNLNDK